jgi:hypothetical protein
VQIIKPDATTEEIDAVLKSGGGAGELMKIAILKGDAADSIRYEYTYVYICVYLYIYEYLCI